MPTDDEIAAAVASSPTAQGIGPEPDVAPSTYPASLVPQPGDNAAVDISGRPDVDMGDASTYVGKDAVGVKSAHKGFDKQAYKNAQLPDQDTPAGLAAFGDQQTKDLADVQARQKAANDEAAGITQKADALEAQHEQDKAEAYKAWAGSEERISAESAAEAHKYIAAYETQKAAVRQMAVDPTGPIGSMSFGSAAGMTLANFAQGFLAARGIHIDVAGQMDKWVERSIQEQQRKIQQANADADSQLHLYEIARQTSSDASEARQRYRGLVISGIQGSLTASAAQYKSDMAIANANAANASLDAEGIKSKQAIWSGVRDRVQKAKTDEETARYHQGLLSLQSQANEIKALRAAAADKSKGLVLIDDPESPGVPKWGIDPTDKEAVTAAKKSRASTGIVMAAIDELEKAHDAAFGKFGENPSLVSGALASPEVRRYQRAQKQVALDVLEYGNSHRYSDNHLKALQDMIPGESDWQRGTNNGAIDDLRKHVRNGFQAAMDTYPTVGRGQTAMPKLNEKFLVQTKGEEARGTPAENTAKGDEVSLGKEASNAVFDRPSAMWTATMPGAQPHAAIAVDHLALSLVQPDVFRSEHKDRADSIPEDDRELRKQSEDAIRTLEATAGDPRVRAYAHEVLEKYHEGGAEAVRRMFAVSNDTIQTPAPNETADIPDNATNE